MIPPRAIRGQVLTVDMWNTLVEAIRQNRPLQGTGVRLRQSTEGVFIDAAQDLAPLEGHRHHRHRRQRQCHTHPAHHPRFPLAKRRRRGH